MEYGHSKLDYTPLPVKGAHEEYTCGGYFLLQVFVIYPC